MIRGVLSLGRVPWRTPRGRPGTGRQAAARRPFAQHRGEVAGLFAKLGRHGTVLVVVDQPASIGALPVAVARACGHEVAYLPGLAMRRIADLHLGTAKTDARDAYVIADAARTLPHTLRRVDAGDETLAELEVLVGFDDDLAGESTRVSNRIRGLLTQIHPPLKRVLGPKAAHPAVLELLSRCGGPARLRQARPATPAARSAATTRPKVATSSSNAPSSWPRSPRWPIHPPAPTTTASEPRARNTTPPSSAWPAAASTFCTPCFAIVLSTGLQPPNRAPRQHEEDRGPRPWRRGQVQPRR